MSLLPLVKPAVSRKRMVAFGFYQRMGHSILCRVVHTDPALRPASRPTIFKMGPVPIFFLSKPDGGGGWAVGGEFVTFPGKWTN